MLPVRWAALVTIAGLALLGTARWAGVTLLRWELGGIEALNDLLPPTFDGDGYVSTRPDDRHHAR